MFRRSLAFGFATAAVMGLRYDTVLAQNNPIVGSWKVTYAAGTRVENGTATTMTGTGKLIVQLQGDSLIARLVPDPVEGSTRSELRLAAPGGAGKAVFVSKGKATINMNGDAKEVTSISTWTLTATGDTLEGTVERKLEGMEMPSRGPGPVSGTRIKG